MRQATQSNPPSAEAYYYLGVAEESDYGFSDAEEISRERSNSLPPTLGYRAHYADFERKVAQSIKSSHPLSD